MSVAEHLVVDVECRDHIAQGVTFGEILHILADEVETVVDTEMPGHGIHLESVELTLCVAQRKVEGRGLEHLARVTGRESESHAAIHDIFAQPHGHLHNTLLGFLIVERIIVERTAHTRERWEIETVVILAHNLLYDHGHLFLVDDI